MPSDARRPGRLPPAANAPISFWPRRLAHQADSVLRPVVSASTSPARRSILWPTKIPTTRAEDAPVKLKRSRSRARPIPTCCSSPIVAPTRSAPRTWPMPSAESLTATAPGRFASAPARPLGLHGKADGGAEAKMERSWRLWRSSKRPERPSTPRRKTSIPLLAPAATQHGVHNLPGGPRPQSRRPTTPSKGGSDGSGPGFPQGEQLRKLADKLE